MDKELVRRFTQALDTLEKEGEVEPICALFSDDAELSNAASEWIYDGVDGARRFWHGYRSNFEKVHSEFRSIVIDEDYAALEWVSRGRAGNDEPFEYGGVTILEFDDGRISRFRSYFNPAHLSFELDATRKKPAVASDETDTSYSSPGRGL